MFLLCFINNFLFLFILTTQLLCWKNKTWRNTSLVSVLPALDKFLLYAHQHNFLVLSRPRQYQQLRCAEFTVLECVAQFCVLLNALLENAWPQKYPFWQQKRQQCFQKPFALTGGHSTLQPGELPKEPHTLVHEHPQWQRTEGVHWAGMNTSTPPVSGLRGSCSPKATSSSPGDLPCALSELTTAFTPPPTMVSLHGDLEVSTLDVILC